MVASEVGLKPAVAIITLFFAIFTTIMVLRSLYKNLVTLRLLGNMMLAGTIIFGGGPVVVPLLREYVVEEGWVSSRDFLIGLAVIQAFPGPSFNFAVYLGALAASSAGVGSWIAALLAFVGIFFSGLTLATGMDGVWKYLRRYRVVTSALRGVNAAAVGLVWTAVYRLWEAGNMTSSSSAVYTLGSDPWWLVIAALSFSSNQWYGVPAPACIVLGGIMGLLRRAVTI